MYLESGSRIVMINDKHIDTVRTPKEARERANELYNIHLSVSWPLPYFDEKNKEDFYLLAEHIRRKSKLACTGEEAEKILLGVSEVYSLKYAEFDKDMGNLILGALDNNTGEITQLVIDITDNPYRCPVDLRVRTAAYEYRITMIESKESSDTIKASIMETLEMYRANPILILREEYVAD